MSLSQESEHRLRQSVELGTLNACYGGLLTEKQRTALRLHCDEDLSLAEIAEQMGATRQNVHELITRSEQKLRRYEAALHLAGQAETTRQALAKAIAALDGGNLPTGRAIISQLLNSLDEEEPSHGL